MYSIRSPSDAVAALDLTRASRDVRAAEHALIEAKLKESRLATALFSKLRDQSSHDLAEAEKDIGRVRAFVRGRGIESTASVTDPLHISISR